MYMKPAKNDIWRREGAVGCQWERCWRVKGVGVEGTCRRKSAVIPIAAKTQKVDSAGRADL